MKEKSEFFLRFIFLFTVTYVVFGILFFYLFTKSYYSEGGAFSGYLVTMENEIEWSRVMLWMVPTQILRSFLLAWVLYPLWKFISKFDFLLRFLFIWSYLWIVSGFAAALPAPGNLEGMLYMNPKINWRIHLEILSEIFFQSAFFSFLFLKWMHR